MSQAFERVATALLVSSAVVVAAASSYRLLWAPASTSREIEPAAVKIPNWRQLETQGFLVHGTEVSKARLTIFADLECPACRGMHEHLQRLAERRGEDVSITYLMFPLSYHRFARQAADATACVGANDGDLNRWITTVYDKQDSLGLLTWRDFAKAAQIESTSNLLRCLDSLPKSAKVDSSAATAVRLGIDATPTILINGWKFSTFKSAAQLDSAVDKIGGLDARR